MRQLLAFSLAQFNVGYSIAKAIRKPLFSTLTVKSLIKFGGIPLPFFRYVKVNNLLCCFCCLHFKLTYVLLDIAILELFPELNKVRGLLTFCYYNYSMPLIVSALSFPRTRIQLSQLQDYKRAYKCMTQNGNS